MKPNKKDWSTYKVLASVKLDRNKTLNLIRLLHQVGKVLVFSPNQTLLVSIPDADQIIALPEKNQDGVADDRRIVLSNLNNPHGLAFHQGQLFVAEETPPDEINLLESGGDYGWPVCYGDQVYDEDFAQRTPDYCENTIPPIFPIPAPPPPPWT